MSPEKRPVPSSQPFASSDEIENLMKRTQASNASTGAPRTTNRHSAIAKTSMVSLDHTCGPAQFLPLAQHGTYCLRSRRLPHSQSTLFDHQLAHRLCSSFGNSLAARNSHSAFIEEHQGIDCGTHAVWKNIECPQYIQRLGLLHFRGGIPLL